MVLWEHYLVYATVLGVAREVMAQMQAILLSMPADERNHWERQRGLLYGAAAHGTGISALESTTSAFNTVFAEARRTVQAAMSQSSSGSGGGGGFSGGGGGGSGSSGGGRGG